MGMTKKDIYNVKNASSKAENFIGEELTLVSVTSFKDNVEDKDTHEVTEKTVVGVKAVDSAGEVVYIASPSATLVSCFTDLEDMLDDGEDIRFVIVTQKSNNGRTFYTVKLV